MRIPRFRVAGLMGLVFVAALVFGSLRFATVLWASSLLFATLIVLGVAILSALFRRGEPRAYWTGFALFGLGYMGLTANIWWPGAESSPIASTMALQSVRPYLDRNMATAGGLSGKSSTFFDILMNDPDASNRAVREVLEAPVTMPFGQETALEDVVKYVASATIRPNFPHGIPIYVDPIGLQEADRTMTSKIVLQMENVPLTTSLTLLLKQLGLRYRLSDGVLTITSIDEDAVAETDAFQRIGHFWFALMFGAIGGLAARRIQGSGRVRTGN